MQSQRPILPRWAVMAIMGAFATVVVLVGLALIEQNKTLKEALSEQRGSNVDSAVGPAYPPGTQVPDVALRYLDGRERRSADITSSQSGVFAVLTTTCPFCELTLPQWEEISKELESRGASFLAISLNSFEDTRAYAEEHAIDFDVAVVNPQDYGRLGVTSVPLTIAFSEGGIVAGSWSGALDANRSGDVLTRIRSALAVAEGSS